MARIALYNTRDLYRETDPVSVARNAQVEEQLAVAVVDAAVILELPGGEPPDGDTAAGKGLSTLARRTGLRCELPGGGNTAVAGSHDRLGMGLAWGPRVRPVPGSWGTFAEGLWHALFWCRLEFGSFELAGYHGPPRVGRPWDEVREQRRAEARMVAAALAPVAQAGPALLVMDANSASAARWPDSDDFYDPDYGTWEDPVEREPDAILARAGWRDAAASCAVPWKGTAGHWQTTDGEPDRRLDRGLVNAAAEDLLGDVQVLDTRAARAARVTYWWCSRCTAEGPIRCTAGRGLPARA